ncbi:MAG: methyltransferase domain-containing protein [Candidatus Omnitrophica bacterium]|nr:methyltransferase domain-containing protein [Candidatus Omnitrophota bacterium]
MDTMRYQVHPSEKAVTVCCPVCGQPGEPGLRRIDFGRCGQCGVMFRVRGGRSRADAAHTEYLDPAVRVKNVFLTQMARVRVSLLQRSAPKGRVLEIGCATGEFVEEAARNGWEIEGIDTSPHYTRHAQARGLPVQCRSIDELAPDEKFDVICMFHLIEHIPAPFPFLHALRRHLRAQGKVVLITPNADARTDRIFGQAHPKFRQADHVVLYSRRGIEALLGDDFDIMQIATKEYPHHFFTSLLGTVKHAVKKDQHKRGGSPLDAPVSRTAYPVCPSLNRAPYALGEMTKTILSPYARWVESRGQGHELIVIAQQKRND